MTKLIEALFERSKACTEMVDESSTKDNYEKETFYKQKSSDTGTPQDEFQTGLDVMCKRKYSCPTLPKFRDDREEMHDNESFECYFNFVKERSVDSDDGISTVESVVSNMDKLNEISGTATKKKMGSRNKAQRKGYEGPANLLVGASSRFFKDFRRDEVYKRKMRSLIEQRVMTRIRYANSK